ncbi:uncharacterized [Tachysurus ichikawai]
MLGNDDKVNSLAAKRVLASSLVLIREAERKPSECPLRPAGLSLAGAYGREGASPQLLPSGTSFRPAGSAPCVLPSVEEACQGQPWYMLTHRAAPTPLGRASCLG